MSLEIPKIRTLLLSYPRSGNTWLRYCVEKLTDKKTTYALFPPFYFGNDNDLEKFGIVSMDSDSLTEVKSNKVILEKTHFWKDEFNEVFNEKKENRLILLIRDYRECLPRHAHFNKNIYLNESKKFNENLKIYDKLNLNKILIYYEDLILKTKETLSKILFFLNEYDEKKLNLFIESLDHHRSESINIYDKTEKSFTKGENLHSHKSKLSDLDINYLDSLFNHKLIEKYK